MNTKKIIPWLILISGIAISLIYSFYSGSKKYSELCLEFQSKSIIEKQNSYSYGFEECQVDEIIYKSSAYSFIFVTTVFHIALVLLNRKAHIKKRLLYLSLEFIILFSLIIFDQILLNSFKHIYYQRWLDSGWTVSQKSQLFDSLNYLGEKPIAWLIILLVYFLLSGITSLGVFLTGLITKNIIGRLKTAFLFIQILLMVQLLLYLVAFPVTFAFLFAVEG